MNRSTRFKMLVVWALLAGACGSIVGCRKSESPGNALNRTSDAAADAAETGPFEFVTETEAKERNTLQEEIRSLLSSGNHARLESMAKEYRETKSKTLSGQWNLAVFYAAFGDWPDEADWQGLLKQGEEWRRQFPQSVTARIALAEIYRAYAWVARTGNTADKVTEEGWRLMGQRLEKALQILSEAGKLPEKCPGWYATAMRVALGANVSRSDYEKLFQNAVKAAPEYGAIYVHKAYYLLPRWHGQPGEWEAFAMAMMKRSDVPHSKEIFARAALGLRSLGYFYEEFSNTESSWNLLKESFLELEKNYPDSLEIKSTFCLICAHLWDYKEAKRQFDLLQGKADLSVWGTKEDFQKMAEWVKFDDAALEKAKQAQKNARGR